MDIELWIDSDSVPKNLRNIILKAATRLDLPTFFVADRNLSDIELFIQEDTFKKRQSLREKGQTPNSVLRNCKSKISMIVVKSAPNSADDYIVEHSHIPALCITHDIPLASRMLEKGAFAIDDSGESFTSQNIKVRLGDRLVNEKLREMGVFAECKSKTKDSSTKAFADNLDRTLTFMMKNL